MNFITKIIFLLFVISFAVVPSFAISNSDSIFVFDNPIHDLKKDNLRILDIGNSYTQDATHYIPQIAAAANATAGYSLYRAVRGGGSFKSWVDTYNDEDTKNCGIGKVCGFTIPDVTTGDGNVGDGHLFRQALKNGKWDLILIHQYSSFSTNFDDWGNTANNAGYLKELISIIRETNPQATIGFLLIHSWSWDSVENRDKSSSKRWNDISNAVKMLKLKYDIDFVVPYGTAVQNLRASYLNDGSDFSTDGSHLADGLGDYVAACCYWETIFAPRFGSIIGNTFRLTTLDDTKKGVFNITDETVSIAQKAAVLATKNMYQITNVDSFDIYMQLPTEYVYNNKRIIGYNYNPPANNVIIPNGAIGISRGVFNGNNKISNLHLPNSIRTFGKYAFHDCSNIETIISQIPGDGLFAIDSTVFSNVDKENCILYVPAGAKGIYATTNGWKDFKNIVAGANLFTATYILNGEVYATKIVEYGADVPLPEEPTKEGYSFVWSEIPVTMPAEDITITGSFEVNSYTVTYMLEGEVYETFTIEYGATIPLPEEPTKEGYTFSVWSEIPATMPAEDITITGSFEVNSYTVTYMLEGEVYETFTIEYGATIPLPEEPTKEGYSFVWSEIPATMPAEDVTIEGYFIYDGTTLLDEVKSKDGKMKYIYDLNGLRILDTEHLEHGIYIIDGKKVLVK